MFWASLCPSSGEQECALPHMVFWTVTRGEPYAAVHTLVLLMMGIMMPETCWDKSLIINIRLVASCWFLSLHPTFVMHGHKSLKFAVPLFLIVRFRPLLLIGEASCHLADLISNQVIPGGVLNRSPHIVFIYFINQSVNHCPTRVCIYYVMKRCMYMFQS